MEAKEHGIIALFLFGGHNRIKNMACSMLNMYSVSLSYTYSTTVSSYSLSLSPSLPLFHVMEDLMYKPTV